ncbi:MAG: DUF2784 domain-containing protein [Balneolaceae bacterium]
MYEFLNVFFFLFHTVLILFNLFGWIWEKTRFFNLITLLLTLASWFILGIWYGWGYCPCTDWHWRVRHELGYYDMPSSYIKFLADTFTGFDWNALLIDSLTVGLLIIAIACSITLNIKDFRDKKNKNSIL